MRHGARVEPCVMAHALSHESIRAARRSHAFPAHIPDTQAAAGRGCAAAKRSMLRETCLLMRLASSNTVPVAS
eukprot:2586804-Rhodomonas_salina.1